ncbi:DUF4926 domain-containing protein [Spirosoma endbachense]|uniref:DUF4926 domain-containing protein n=1 Tax=Spirosoma endbachense TaxID=2666025 RepID=A0A6P1VWF7_9BACT|nr:DUF4926 domain-containing protein [Spirosoma endbachense]QHV96019.1 DUF4926 domain-containing protein [Spirosoma endbachense]
MDSPTLLDVVVLLTDIPAEKLRKGSLGTIVETFDNGNFLVEFADLNGATYAMPVLPATQLLKVYQKPIAA